MGGSTEVVDPLSVTCLWQFLPFPAPSSGMSCRSPCGPLGQCRGCTPTDTDGSPVT
jgi:hypothetical protein